MSLTKEQYEQLPDFVKSDYVETDDGYKHGGFVKVKQTADDLNSKFESERKERQALNERLSEFEKTKAAEIEAARKEELEKARTKGDVVEIEKRYQEQMTDLEKRTAEKVRAETLAEVAEREAESKAVNITDKIARKLAVDDGAADALFELLRKRVTFSNDKPIFINDDGSASSLDESGFIDEVKKSPRYKYLIKAEPSTNGGGFVKGSKGLGSAEPSSSNINARRVTRADKVNRVANIANKFNL